MKLQFGKTHLRSLKKIRGVKQHTKKWEQLKATYFGANDATSILGHGYKTRDQVIQEKICTALGLPSPSPLPDARQQELMHKGTRYEPIVRNLYMKRHDVMIIETGLNKHPEYKWQTASPDGYMVINGEEFLTEFKVRSSLSDGNIPYKFWIQMQIQMAVFNIQKCVYCENVIEEFPDHQTYVHEINRFAGARGSEDAHGILYEDDKVYYWRLKEYRDIVVPFEPGFFNSSIQILEETWNTIQNQIKNKTNRQGVLTRAALNTGKRKRYEEDEAVDESEVCLGHKRKCLDLELSVQPWMLNNFIRQDPVIDWLELYDDHSHKDTAPTPFLHMIKRKHLEFASLVRAYIRTNYNYPGFVVDIDPFPVEDIQNTMVSVEPQNLSVSDCSVTATREAIGNLVPIILNPCFKTTVTFYQPKTDEVENVNTERTITCEITGRADMLILNQFRDQLLNIDTSIYQEPYDKYSLVNFKFSTINLRTDGLHLLNNPKQKVYKSQLWLLNKALEHEQSYLSQHAFMIGRKYDYKSQGKSTKINNAFGAVGIIEYTDYQYDAQYNDLCWNGIQWLQRVRSNHYKELDLFNPSDETPEMFPNMKNHNDYPWHRRKLEVARKIKEITLMYHCGPKVRQYAIEEGITEWVDLEVGNIHGKGPNISAQIHKFIETNRKLEESKTVVPIDNDKIKQVTGLVPMNNSAVPCMEFYIDFEAISSMYDDFRNFPSASENAMIYLIGAVIVDNVTGIIKHYTYIVDKLDKTCERAIVHNMFNDFTELCDQYDQDYIPLYYWSNAEKYMLDRAIGAENVKKYQPIMIDLCKFFRDNKIILPGQYGYGLKDVAKTMHEAGLIETMWRESDICNGIDAMVEGLRNYTCRDDDSLKREFYRDVVEYNYVDCKVMQEIVQYFRDCS